LERDPQKLLDLTFGAVAFVLDGGELRMAVRRGSVGGPRPAFYRLTLITQDGEHVIERHKPRGSQHALAFDSYFVWNAFLAARTWSSTRHFEIRRLFFQLVVAHEISS
jgi:hypothetical protein